MNFSLTIVVGFCCIAASWALEKKPVVLPDPKPIADAENNIGHSATSEGHSFEEGDMVKTPNDKEGGSDRNAIKDNGRNRWPKVNGVVQVPFKFRNDATQAMRKQFLAAAKDYAAWTCIQFVDRGNEKDYLEVIKDNGCWSYVGKSGGKQPLSLGEGCQYDKGTATHEMMHALGFHHEQNRADRDQYLYIYKQNVDPNNLHNFDLCDNSKCDLNRDLPYDVTSVMHYSMTAFSMNRQKTMVPRDSNVKKLGQRAGLCDLDIKKLNWMYKCNGKTASSNKPNNGQIPCKVPADNWSNCADFKSKCSTPGDDGSYRILTNCPVTCKGVKKGDKYDKWSNCADLARNGCNDSNNPWVKTDCALSCSKRSG